MDNLARMRDALRRLQEEGGGGGFVIFHADSKKNYYVQLTGSAQETAVRGEAVGNRFLAPEWKLSGAVEQRLTSLGWNPPSKSESDNFWREWEARTEEDRTRIVEVLHRTLVEVYGFSDERELEIELNLE